MSFCRGKTWRCPTYVVPRKTTALHDFTVFLGRSFLKKELNHYISSLTALRNVIHADHLRSVIDALAEQAVSCFIIFDEVDEMYASTLRTSAARRLCQLCPKFVAQTATPLRKNEAQLLCWLQDTCSFPVDRRNWLVAASGMVSMQLELGVLSVEELELVPMVDEVRFECRKFSRAARWLEMAAVVQRHTDVAMVQLALKAAEEEKRIETFRSSLLWRIVVIIPMAASCSWPTRAPPAPAQVFMYELFMNLEPKDI